MSVEVLFTDEFGAWWEGLTIEEQKSVGVVIELLAKFGVMLGYPQCSSIETSKKLRELPIQHGGEPYRVLYAFDPARNAVLLLGGKKTGQDRWYEQNVTRAEKILADYLRETRQ